jgi:hypothetical protein
LTLSGSDSGLSTLLLVRRAGHSLALLLATTCLLATERPSVRFVRHAEVAELLKALAADAPADLPPLSSGEKKWLTWVERRDAAIRARVLRAEEDALAYLLAYGTSYTKAPRLTRGFMNEAADRAARNGSGTAGAERIVGDAIDARVQDLVSAARTPGEDERLAWVRGTLTRLGMQLDTAASIQRAHVYLLQNFARVSRESEQFSASLAASRSKGERADVANRAHVFASRALASDTSWPIAFGVHDALSSLESDGALHRGAVRRAAVIGPGLDFVDKAEGHDYYPPQTLQPFALADSLLALGLSSRGALAITTYDVSPRVNEHLRRLVSGTETSPYDVQLVRDPAVAWTPDARIWWASALGQVGSSVTPLAAPDAAGRLERRAVRLSSAVRQLMTPVDLDIIYQRADREPGDRFDLVVATNIFVYYDAFEQALAMSNISAMLAPDGVLLTNDWLGDDDRLPLGPKGERLVRFSDRPGDGERMWVYKSVHR